MCELFGISSNEALQPTALLRQYGRRGGDTANNPDGWGLAYMEGNAWQLHKAPEPAARSEHFARLSQNIRTNLLIAHVRKANPPTACTLTNTHPFVRDCCGRPWVFAHNGKVPEVIHPEGCCHPKESQPFGNTDSEHAFYFLLDEIAKVFSDVVTGGNAAWLNKLATFSEAIADYGQFNFLMSDGVYLIAYGHDRLHRLQRRDNGLKVWLLASEPLNDDESWEVFQTGELQVFQAGELIGRLQTTPTWADPSDSVNESGREQTI